MPFHGGFGLLNLHGIPKPTYRAFELLHRLGNEMLHVEGTHPTVDAWVIRRDPAVTILLTNHALPRHPLTRRRFTSSSSVPHTRLPSSPEHTIDEEHANPKRLWQEMGGPEYPRSQQVERLQEASQMVRQPHAWKEQDGTLHLEIRLPPHAVAALTVEFASGETRWQRETEP